MKSITAQMASQIPSGRCGFMVPNITEVTFGMILLALLQAAQNPPQRGVADPGVIATNQRITPAGVQSVFEGRVTGLRFGREPGEVWVAVPGSVYRMRVGRQPGAGSRADQRPRRDLRPRARTPSPARILVSSVGRVPAGLQRPAGAPPMHRSIAQLAAITGDSLRPFGGFGHDMAGVAGGCAARERERAPRCGAAAHRRRSTRHRRCRQRDAASHRPAGCRAARGGRVGGRHRRVGHRACGPAAAARRSRRSGNAARRAPSRFAIDSARDRDAGHGGANRSRDRCSRPAH